MSEGQTDLVVANDPQSVTIFGSNDAEVITERVKSIARFVAEIVESGNLTSNISGRKYVNVEGWQAAGAGVGLSAYIESCEPLGPPNEQGVVPGYLAVATLRNRAGDVLARAEASCERDESTWRNRPNFALRSMAQTRVTGRAFRQVLGFVMTVAGYEGSLAEEMTEVELASAPPRPGRATVARGGSTRPATRPSVPSPAPEPPDTARWWRVPAVEAMKGTEMRISVWAHKALGIDIENKPQEQVIDEITHMLEINEWTVEDVTNSVKMLIEE